MSDRNFSEVGKKKISAYNSATVSMRGKGKINCSNKKLRGKDAEFPGVSTRSSKRRSERGKVGGNGLDLGCAKTRRKSMTAEQGIRGGVKKGKGREGAKGLPKGKTNLNEWLTPV